MRMYIIRDSLDVYFDNFTWTENRTDSSKIKEKKGKA